MNRPKSSAELKSMARGQLLGRYPACVGALFLYFAIVMVITTVTVLAVDLSKPFGMIVYFIVMFLIQLLCSVFRVGFAYQYLNLVSGRSAGSMNLFYGFKSHADKAIIIGFLLTLLRYIALLPYYGLNWYYAASQSSVVFVASCAFLIIGYAVLIAVSLIFSQCYYIMLDLPQYGALETMRLSRELVKGHKGRLFYIGISFVPVCLLGILSFGIGFLWLWPYINATLANFYFDVVRVRQQTRTESADAARTAEPELQAGTE